MPVKALEPIAVTESGITTEIKLEHVAKAISPMVLTELPMVTVVKLLHE